MVIGSAAVFLGIDIERAWSSMLKDYREYRKVEISEFRRSR